MTQPNLLDILARTPVWVFAVFLVLLALGYQQSRTRTVSRQRFLLLPVAMMALSLYGVVSAFGVALVPLLAWVMGAGGVAVLGARCLPSSAQPVAPGGFAGSGQLVAAGIDDGDFRDQVRDWLRVGAQP